MKRLFVILIAASLFSSPLFFSCKNKDKTTQEQKTDAPVTINPDDQLRTSANNVLAAYPGVTADVRDGVITLRGNIKRDSLQNLMAKIQELRPKKVENQLVIQ